MSNQSQMHIHPDVLSCTVLEVSVKSFQLFLVWGLATAISARNGLPSGAQGGVFCAADAVMAAVTGLPWLPLIFMGLGTTAFTLWVRPFI